jgi:tRNA A37 N6-isopentenylltransferase MiaA
MKIEKELRDLEKKEAHLFKKKAELIRILQEDEMRSHRLQEIFDSSGYSSPLHLVEALIRKFSIRVTGENSFAKKRKRTHVTAELRDNIRQECSSGLSMNRASKKYGVSYAVVTRVMQGRYDHCA